MIKRCPWCNDERIETLIAMMEAWTNEDKMRLTTGDWVSIARVIDYANQIQQETGDR